MAIVLDGNLGITSPAETVQGALTTTGNTILGDASTDTLNVGNGGLVKDASGNVGIGTASPTERLGVLSALTGTTTGSNVVGRFQSNGSGYDCNIAMGDNVNASTRLGYLSGAMYFWTNGAEQARITTAGLLQFNSGYGSAATAYGCRAWVNFNGTGTVAIRASGNVSSITDNGTGDYTVNFTTAMVDVNYSTVVGISRGATGAFCSNIATDGTSGLDVAPTTSAIRVTANGGSGLGGRDVAYANVSVFR